jgi:hypothetical protein
LRKSVESIIPLWDKYNELMTPKNQELINGYINTTSETTKLKSLRNGFLTATDFGAAYKELIDKQAKANNKELWYQDDAGFGDGVVSVLNSVPEFISGVRSVLDLADWRLNDDDRVRNKMEGDFNLGAEGLRGVTSQTPVFDPVTGDINYSALTPTVGRTIADMFMMARGGMFITKASTKIAGKVAKYGVKKFPRIGTVTTKFTPAVKSAINTSAPLFASLPLLYPSNLSSAIEQISDDFSAEDAVRYAMQTAVTEGMIEMISPDIKFMSPSIRTVKRNLKKGESLVDALIVSRKAALAESLIGVTPEVLEEFAQNAANGLISKRYNENFNTDFAIADADSYKETALVTLLSTLGMKTLSGNLLKMDVTPVLRVASENSDLFIDQLNLAMKKGKITEEQGKQMLKDVESYTLASGEVDDIVFGPDGKAQITESQKDRLVVAIQQRNKLKTEIQENPNSPLIKELKKELENVEQAINAERNLIKSEGNQGNLLWNEAKVESLKTQLSDDKKAKRKNKRKGNKDSSLELTQAKIEEIENEIVKLEKQSEEFRAESPEYSIAGKAYSSKSEFLTAMRKARKLMGDPKNRKNLNIRVKNDWEAEQAAYNILGAKYIPQAVRDRVIMTTKQAQKAEDFIQDNGGEAGLMEGLNKELSKSKSSQNAIKIQQYRDALKYVSLKSRDYIFGEPGFLVKPNKLSKADLQDVRLEANLETTQKAIDQIGMKREIFNTTEEAVEKYGKIIEGSNGFFTTTYDDNGEVTGYVQVVIKDEAIKKGARSTGSHEFLHDVTFGIINGPIREIKRPKGKNGQPGRSVWVKISPEGVKLVKGFLKLLPQEQVDILDEKLKNGGYKYDEEGNELAFEEYAEEYLEMYSDAVIVDKTIPIDTPKAKSVFKRIIDYFNSVFKKFLQNGKEEDVDTTNIDIKSPEDLLGFLKSYNSQIMSEKIGAQVIELGKRSVIAQQDAIREDSENANYQDFLDKQFAEETNSIMKSNAKITRADAKKAAIKKLRPGMMSKSKALDDKKKQDLFSKTNKTLSESLKPYGLKGDFDSNNKDHLALWEKLTVRDKRFIGYTLGKIWRPYAQNKLWEKYSRIPNYDLFEAEILDVLTTGMQVGENGLPFVVSTWDPSKRKLTSHIWDLLPKRIHHVITNVPQFAGFGKTIDENFSEDINDRLKEETRPKTNILKFDKVKNKVNELMDVIGIAPIGKNTFKTVDEYTGKVAEIIFDIPAEKATKGNKNLSHKTKVVNGMMELSQAGKIQDFFRVGDNLENLVKIMVPENVTSKTADISEVGENIDVARDIYGRSIGLKGKVLEYFFDRTEKRSQGLTTQPNVWELKPEFKKPSKETLEQLRADLGITPQGDANISDRAFNGQLLKGIAEYQAYQTAISITQRKLDAIKQEAATKEEKSAISQDIANVTAAQSRFAFSKNSKYSEEIIEGWDAFSQLAKNPDFKGNIKVAIREIYGEGLSAESIGTIEGLAKKYLDSFNDIGDIVEHFRFNFDLDQVTYTLKSALGFNGTLQELFYNPEDIKFLRENIINTVEDLRKQGFSETEIAEIMFLLAPGLTGNGAIGDGNTFIVDPDNITSVIPGVSYSGNTGKKRGFRFSPSFTTGIADFIKLINTKIDKDGNLYEDPFVRIINKGPNANKGFKYEVKENGKWVPLKTRKFSETTTSALKDSDYGGRNLEGLKARLATKALLDTAWKRVKSGEMTRKQFGAIIASLGSSMGGSTRKSASYKGKQRNIEEVIARGNKKGIKPGKSTQYEHNVSLAELVDRIVDSYEKHNTITDDVYDGYHVNIVSAVLNKAVDKVGLQTKQAPTLGDSRYFNDQVYNWLIANDGKIVDGLLIDLNDVDVVELMNEDGTTTVIGEKMVNDIREYQARTSKVDKNKVKEQSAQSVAIMRSRTANPAKGISVFDLDDTLATTKSGVRYTLPNPDGTPQPKKKVIFMAGGPGSGKSNVINQLGLKEQGFKVVNQDISLEWLMKNHGMPTDMREFTPEQASEFGKLSAEARGIALKKRIKYQGEGDGVIIDGTGASLNVMKKNIQDFKDKGYDVQMVFVETSQETALSRNKARKERSLRTGIVIKTHDSVQANKEAYKELFGERFAEVNTDNLEQGDAMPADVVNKVNDFTSGYIKGRLNAGEYATKGEELKQQGAEFDFSEFNQIIDGKTAPLFEKALKLQAKFGSKDMFVLTARPAESAQAVFEFLQANGLNIPMENIVGLGSSLSSDKALWMAGKVGEGYNDFYFADDILENVQAVSDMLDQFDVKSKIQQAKRDFVLGDPVVTKIVDNRSMNDVKDVDGLANPGTYNNIKFSKSHRVEYENTIAKNRPDLVRENLVTTTIDRMFEYIDGLDVPNKRKYEQITTKWLATSNIKLPEDSYKIQQAVEIAELKKEDIFSYKNPNEIIEKYAGTIKVKPISPVGIKEFTRATGFNDPIAEYGIVEYEVEETREAQQKVRDIVNTHWGPNSNPWCITKIDKDGNLSEDAWRDWTSYRKGPKRIIFQNGKLLAMKANYEYWGKMNKHSEGPIIQVKEGNVTNTTELVVGDGGIVDPIIRETRTVSKDGNTVTTNIFENSQDGYAEGTTIVENRIKGVKTKETRFDPDGSKVNTQEFNKKGKPTTSYQFNPNGKVKSVNGHLQQQAITEAGLDVNAREDADIDLTNELVVRVGDIIENNYTETETDGTTTDYFYGRALVGDQVVEIGFESKTGLDLADVTKTVDGKTRLDIGKVLREVDPNVKGLPKTNIMFSKGTSREFNDIIEQSTGVGSEKVFSDAQAKIRGNKMRFDNIVPYSVQDLMGLLYNFVGKGKAGEQHMEFFKKALIDPFARAINELNKSKQSSANDYRNLTKDFPNVKKKLNKEIEGGDYTYDQAIRVYLWNKAGFEVPGLSKRDLNALDSIVKNDPELQAFADTLGLISKKEEGYAKPGEHWLVENIASDLLSDGSIGDARSEFLAEWQQNADEMFSKENLNKIQVIYGNKFREALEDILYRMKHGTNRPTGSSRLTNNFMNWINNSTGAIMFFNMRSALLQTLSTTNYINWTDNNPLKAAAAFANQKQYWSDFSALFNSDFLKQRRSGNQRSINEAELTTAVANSDNKAKAAIAWLLQKGFLPTQIMDSFAISAGGATFYRNRVNKYIKEGMTPEQAQEKAFLDFQEITEATQQSARPDMISQQQASPLGRLILSFQNTPMQYARIMNKAARDLAAGRGDAKHNISKIVYYGALQSIIFAALQSAIFAALGDDEEEEFDKKKQRIIDSMVDGWLAGLGVAGKAIGTINRAIDEYLEQEAKGFNSDHAQTIIALLGFSPPIGSKVRKIYSAIQTEQFNKGVSEKRGFTLDNPTWSTWGNIIEGFTNIPLGRMSNKMLNIDNALDSQNQWWERVALILGWNTWDLGIKDPDIEAARGEIKEEKKIEKKKEAIIKKEEKKKEVEKENISKEEANIEIQKKEIEAGNKSPDCAAINKRGERCGTKIEKGSTYCTVHAKVEQSSSGEKVQCGKIKNDGDQCKMKTANKSGFCYYHD